MQITLNQLMRELEEIASAHQQINEFFQGDFLDAISRDAAKYPLMVATLQPGYLNESSVQISLVITICDKYNLGEYRQINEVHSDCLSILNDINTTFRQYRFTEFMDITDDISMDPFINEGQDMVAGWAMNVNCEVYNDLNWCNIPYSSYDFENGIPAPIACGDLYTTFNIYFNGNLIDTFSQLTTENNTINITF